MLRLFLVFPIAVVLLASVAFLFGGCCAAWQWWLATAVAVASGFWRRSTRDGVRTGLIFFSWMAIAWVGCGLAVAPNWFDEAVYHIPAVRMLADGWNPLFVSTPEELLRLTGFDATDFRVDHVLFMPKIVWIFSAVAYFFTNDLLNPLVPILWFLVPPVMIRIWRSMEGASLVWKALAVPLVYCLLLNSAYVVDVVVQLAAIGLLLSFEETLSGRRIDILSLVAFSFWMMGAKAPGLVHGGFFWTIFLAFAFFKKVNWRPLALIVAAVSILLALACATPYLTSIRNYGHPFYPSYSSDEKRFPVRNITEDFITGQNEDAASMGFVGKFVNSYISPPLARAWYRWRMQKPDFMPYSQNYRHYPNDGDGSEPTRRSMRIAFWFSVVLMTVVVAKSFRPLALMIVLGIAVVPLPLMGYIRYIPWWLSPILFLYVGLVRDGRRGRWRYALACVLLLGLFSIRPYTLMKKIGYTMLLVDERCQLREMLAEKRAFPPIRPYVRFSLAQLKMMRREFPSLARAELLPYSKRREREFRSANLELPGKLFIFDDPKETRRYAYVVPEGTMQRFAHVARICFTTFPIAIVERIGALFENRREGEAK